MARQNIHNTRSGDIFVESEMKQWGNSVGIRIPKEIRCNLDLVNGSKVIVSLDRRNKKITIETLDTKHQNLFDFARNVDLEGLIKKITKKNKPKESAFLSEITGKEIW
jgi:antitoxin component of MazEF toxin-antitoxin module